MCLGMIGDAFQAVDTALKPVGDFSQKLYQDTLGWAMPKQVDQFSDWATHHPAEVGVAIGTGFTAASALGGAGAAAEGTSQAATAGAAVTAGDTTAMGTAAGTLGAADSATVPLAADVSVGTTGAGGATAAAGGAASTTPGWVSGLSTAAKYVAPAVVSSLLQPKPPKTKAPQAMPDPLAQQQAQQQKLLQQLARRGRSSTILTNPGSASGALGG